MRQRSGVLSDSSIAHKCRAYRPIPMKRAEEILWKPSVWNLVYQLQLPKNQLMTNRPVNFQALASTLARTYEPNNKQAFQRELDAQYTADINTEDPTDLHIGTMGRADFESTLSHIPQPVRAQQTSKNQDPRVSTIIHQQLQQLAILQNKAARDAQLNSLLGRTLQDLNNFYATIYKQMSQSIIQANAFEMPSVMQRKVGGSAHDRGPVAAELLRAMELYGMAPALLELSNVYGYVPQFAHSSQYQPLSAAQVQPVPAPGGKGGTSQATAGTSTQQSQAPTALRHQSSGGSSSGSVGGLAAQARAQAAARAAAHGPQQQLASGVGWASQQGYGGAN
jgi:hypothetical protein